MKRKTLLPIFLLIFSGLLFAQEKLSLSQCLHLAYQNNHLLKAAGLQEEQALVQLKLSRTKRLPVVNLLSGYTRIGRLSTIEFSTGPGVPPRKLTFGTPNRMNLDLRLQMPLFTWWRIKNGISLAETGLQFNRLETEKQKIAVTAQVLQAYFSALLAKKMVELSAQNLERTREYLAITQKRFNSGQLPKLELLRAQVKMKNEESRWQNARAEYDKSLAFLASVTGTKAAQIAPEGELQFLPFKANEQDLFKQALQQRIEIKQLESQKNMLHFQQKISAAGDKPTLGLISSYSVMNGFNPMDPEKFYTNYNIGLQLSWALFDGFNSRYQTQGLHYQQQALSEQRKAVEENIKLQIRQALISLTQAAQKIESQQANIELAREALQLAQKQYDQGVSSSLDLLDAQTVLLQTEMGYWQAVFSHILAKIELAKAIGNFSMFENQM